MQDHLNAEVIATRERLFSEDIFKEIDDIASSPVLKNLGGPHQGAMSKQQSFNSAMEGQDALSVPPEQTLQLSDFSDKNLQKLVKLTEQQADRVKTVITQIDKSTVALKRVNKGYKSQSQQLKQKIQNSFGPQGQLVKQCVVKQATVMGDQTISVSYAY